MTGPYDPYADPERLEDAVGRLTDPLNDPLPNQSSPAEPGHGRHRQNGPRGAHGQRGPQRSGVNGQGSPWFRPPRHAAGHTGHADQLAAQNGQHPTQAYAPQQTYEQQAYGSYRQQEPYDQRDLDSFGAYDGTYDASTDPPPDLEPPELQEPRPDLVGEPERKGSDTETVALRQARRKRRSQTDEAEEKNRTARSAAGGRAARRKAAAKARKGGLGVMASRAIGELFITTGVLLLLFVTYQLWWTNIQANQHANGEANNLERAFEEDGDGEDKEPEKFEAGEGFAIMYIPKLDVRVPVAEGIEKGGVLDRGMAGHYDKKSGLKTAMPWDEKGNFAVAGHRNTHGEPFRYINKLDPDDEIIVETQSTYYTYKVANRLASTSPSNIDVINPVPKQSGFTKPGRYITLTTCTPEFSSKYRLIVWGTMVDERPRSEGKPEALGG